MSGATSSSTPANNHALVEIYVCELQVRYTEQMTEHFLLVASDSNATKNKQLMSKIIVLFNTGMTDLINGNPSKHIQAPIQQAVKDMLAETKTVWDAYKLLLESNVNTVGSTSLDILSQIHVQSTAMKAKVEDVLAMYVGSAMVDGIKESGDKAYAQHYSQYFDTIRKEILFVSLKVKTTLYLDDIKATDIALKNVRDSLLYGNPVAGVPELVQMCILAQMLQVDKVFATYREHLIEMQQTNSITETLLLSFVTTGEELYHQMELLLDLYQQDDGSCNAASKITDDGWFNLITEANNQLMLSQKATRLYLQLAKSNQTEGSDMLMQVMSDAQTSLRKCMKGSYSDNIPSPPTQGIVDALSHSWSLWKRFDQEVRHSINLKEFTHQLINDVSHESAAIWDNMRMIGDMCVNASLKSKPNITSIVWGVSQRQGSLLQKMSSEALLVSLDENVVSHTAQFVLSTEAFESSHWQLLMGRSNGSELSLTTVHDDAGHAANATNSTNATTTTNDTNQERRASAVSGVIKSNMEAVLYKDKALPRTTDACTLTVMHDVLNYFDQLKGLQQRLIDNNFNKNSSTELLSTIHQIDSLSPLATDLMGKAVQYYKNGHGVCTTILSPTMWEITLDKSATMTYLLQKAMTDYYLVAGGYSAQWLENSAKALAEHKGFIAHEAAQPELVTVILEFKSAWDSFKATDEERLLGLAAAYITLNKHPAGEKDKLDTAEGPEDYHAVHLKHHPHYRKVLYDRNYYDIFMLDLEGNCIYSVYKELDFATNFAANGTGKWKTSGLGEAFEAAMAHPDKVNVIDWKPYGPSYGAYASFLATGVKNQWGQMLGVFCTQMPPESQPIDSAKTLSATVAHIEKDLKGLKFGDDAKHIPPPPNQAVADSLFQLSDEWETVKPVLSATPDVKKVPSIMTHNAALVPRSKALLQTYVDAAFSEAPKLQSVRISIVSLQRERVQAMCKTAVLLGLNIQRRLAANSTPAQGVTRTSLLDEIAYFEKTHVLLVDGGEDHGRTVQPVPVQGPEASLLEDAHTSWLSLVPTLRSIADGGDVSEPVMRNVVTQTEAVVGSIDNHFSFLATTTRTTTLMTLEILAPMPFSGEWSGGATMKVASLLAEGVINEQQKILPGYNLKSVFFDDKCDTDESSRIVLGEMAKKDTYVALGGAGCSKVCASTQFSAETQQLPFLSYECAAASLSNAATYPDLTRLGTVTTAAIDIIANIGKNVNHSWSRITVISGDPSKYQDEAKLMQEAFLANGFASNYVYAFENDWDQILAMMTKLKQESKGMERVYFLVGTEDYFRKLICASIVAEAEPGITWLSQGSWPDAWWKTTDRLSGLHRQWLMQDSGGDQLKAMFSEFKAAWDGYLPNSTDEARRTALANLYHTDLLDKLDVAAGPEQYHTVHKKWHPVYRKTLYDRGYYDIFIFDLKGDCIYSVYKESDYATNFAKSGNGKWKDSGLGDAFRTALDNPDNVSYIDWKAYGPSAGALAAFLTTGIRDKDGELVGVYAIQLPPDYVRSIEEVQPECSLAKMASSFEGAINVVGLGRPSEDKMVAPMSCFDGYSPQSFLTLLDQHLSGGYPLGDRATQVPNPYSMIKAHAADAVCVIAFTVKYLLEQGHAIEDIQKPDKALYAKFLDYVKTKIDFPGASGQVKFSGNDKPNSLVVQQVQKGSNVDVGLLSPTEGADITWIAGGPDASAWKQEPNPRPPSNFPYLAIRVLTPVIVIVTPLIIGCVRGWRPRKEEMEEMSDPATAQM